MEKMILSHIWSIRSPKYVVSCPQYEVVLTYKVLVCMYVTVGKVLVTMHCVWFGGFEVSNTNLI